MPYQVYPEDGKFCVHKKNPDGSMGTLIHCHDTKDKAMAQMRALYANTNELSLAIHTHVTSQTVRSESFQGKDYLVVVGVPVKEQVLNGAFLPADEISHFVEAWNGVPITINHPSKSGKDHGSANSPHPEVAIIGRFFNAEWDDQNRKMVGEYWIDTTEAAKWGEGLSIINAIHEKKILEVSTGYYADQEDTTGIFKGVSYQLIHRNLRPDHIAILLGKLGACSVQDGCGLNRNASDITEDDCPENCPILMSRKKQEKTMKKTALVTQLEKLGFKFEETDDEEAEPKIIEFPVALQEKDPDEDDDEKEEEEEEGENDNRQPALNADEIAALKTLAQSSAAITAFVQNAQTSEKTRRVQLNTAIKAASGVYSDEDLNALPMPFLEKLNGQLNTDFTGQGVTVLNNVSEDDVLVAPAMFLAKPDAKKEK